MALQRYSSQVITENRPVYADAGAFRYSDVAGQVVGNLGQELGQVADVADQMAQIQKRLDEKYQNHIDSLQMAKANDFLQAASASIDGIYENVKDTTQWDGLVRKEIDKANGAVRQILSTMSPQAREFAEQQMKQFGEMQTIKMRSLRAKTAASQNRTMLMSTYETAISQGNDQQAEMARAAMDERWNDWFGSKEEYESALKTIEDRGIQEYNQNQLNIVRDEVAAMAELQTPIEDISQFIDDTMPDASNRQELKSYATSLLQHNRADANRKYDIIIGNISKSISEYINNPENTPSQKYTFITTAFNELRNNPNVPPEKVADLLTEETKWKNALDAELERRRPEKYSSAAYLDLVKRFETATSESEANAIMSDAILARANGLISKEEEADINTMGSHFVSNQFYNQASYKDNAKRFESLAIPSFDMQSYFMMPGTDKSVEGFTRLLLKRRQASDWYIAKAKADWNKWYAANKDATDEQKQQMAESMVLKLSIDPESIISMYEDAVANKTVADNKYIPVNNPVKPKPQYKYIVGSGNDKLGSNDGKTWTKIQ